MGRIKTFIAKKLLKALNVDTEATIQDAGSAGGQRDPETSIVKRVGLRQGDITTKDFEDPEIKFGIAITYFANNTAYMKQAEIEGNLKVGTDEQTPSISLGRFKLQIESNGSLSIVMT